MGRGLSGRIKVIIEMDEVEDGEGAGEATKRLAHNLTYEWRFTSGTTNGTTMDRVWSGAPDLTTTPTDLDLVGTSNLPSVLDAGNNVNLTDLCVVCAINEAASGSGDIQVGAGSNPVDGIWLAAGDGVKVKPQGLFLWIAPDGIAPTAGTADILRAVASSGTVPSKVLLAGRSL